MKNKLSNRKTVLAIIVTNIFLFSQYSVQALEMSSMDFNHDGVVDRADLAIIENNIGSSNNIFDLNGDGIVDIYDLTIISNKLEKSFQDNDFYAIGNNFSNLQNSSFAALSNNMVYYRNFEELGRLYTATLDREYKKRLTDEPVSCINVIGNTVYYMNLNENGSIYSINIDGSNRKCIANDNTSNFVVDGDWIIYRNKADGQKLYKLKRDGSEKVKLSDDIIKTFLANNKYVFYINESDNSTLYRMNLDGTNRQRILNLIVRNFVIEKGVFYYINGSDGNKIYSVNLDGLNNRLLVSEDVVNLNVTNDWIYYSNRADGRLTKVYIDGNQKKYIGTEVLPSDENQNRISIIQDWVYYNNANDGNRIYRINTDGNGKKEVDPYIIARVNTDGLSFRTSPVVSSSTLISALPYGTKLEIIGSANNPKLWYKVNYQVNGQIKVGYVSSSYVLPVSDDRLNNFMGFLSSKYESNGDTGCVSNLAGDSGGKSYGVWQLSSNMGSLASFIGWLRDKNINFYNLLMDARNSDGNTYGTNFDNAWRGLAQTNSEEFYNLQKEYIKYAYYEPSAAKIKQKYGLDVNSMSLAFKNVVFSTAVQHGVGGASTVYSNINMGLQERELLSAVYDERSKVDKYFANNSESVKQGVYARFQTERQDALKMYDYEKNGN